jgi:hypothetical protein
MAVTTRLELATSAVTELSDCHPEVGRPDATAKIRGVSKTRHEHFVANEKEKCISSFFHHLL